jgi:hypothetical protein
VRTLGTFAEVGGLEKSGIVDEEGVGHAAHGERRRRQGMKAVGQRAGLHQFARIDCSRGRRRDREIHQRQYPRSIVRLPCVHTTWQSSVSNHLAKQTCAVAVPRRLHPQARLSACASTSSEVVAMK